MLLPGGFGLATVRTLIDPGTAMHAGVNMSRILQHGKQIFQKIFLKQKVKVDQIKRIDRCKKERFAASEQYKLAENVRPFARYIQRFGIRTLASELRRKAALQFRNGQLPTFAFAFGLVVCQNQQNNDSVSSEIREIFKGSDAQPTCLLHKVQRLSLDVINFGNQIGQGCNAAVFEARINECDESSDSDIDILSNPESVIYQNTDSESENEDLQFVFEHFSQEIAPVTDQALLDYHEDIIIVPHSSEQLQADDLMMLPMSDSMSDESTDDSGSSPDTMKVDNDFNLAVKMMFNYEVESNAQKITQIMEKEIVPAQISSIGCEKWHSSNKVRLKTLPPHNNIVEMVGMFVDSVPCDLQEAARENFPHALPPRLNPEGLGRNMTMFIIMKKYDCTLREYLNQNDLSLMNRCQLLLQLVEGVVHLTNHNVAHRDLKSNNILIDLDGTNGCLVISDFGCCHADPEYGMKLPYFSMDTDKGGNPALMAPEISSASAGYGVWLDYSKSDLWTVGTLVYEIFGMENPFSRGNQSLSSETYKEEDLPKLPDNVPETIKKLTAQLLRRKPKERPSAVVAANTIHLYLQYPDWFTSECKPSVSMVTDSLLLLTTEKIFMKSKKENFGISENLSNMFLKRVNVNDILRILNWFHFNK